MIFICFLHLVSVGCGSDSRRCSSIFPIYESLKKSRRTFRAGRQKPAALVPILGILFLMGGAGRIPARAADEVRLQWLGHSAFLFTTTDGVRIVFDPVSRKGTPRLPTVEADVVLLSHDHSDHAYLGLVRGSPSLLRGLGSGGREWNRVEFEIGDARIYNVASYHDREKGSRHGLNSIFVVELPNLKFVHLGDLGHPLEEGQVQPLRGTDVLVIPVGGASSLDARSAAEVVDQIRPNSYVIPMHYAGKTSAVKGLSPVDPFLEGKAVQRVAGATYTFDLSKLPTDLTYLVFEVP